MKRKCLVIIPGIPFPPVDGHKLKIYNLILILSKYFDLHIISISKDSLTSEQIGFLAKYSYRYKHFKLGTFESLFRLFRSFFSRKPFQVNYFTLSSVKRYIKSDTEDEELVVLNLIRTCGYLDLLSEKFTILDMVDSMSNSYMKSKETTTSVLYRFIYGIEGNRLVNFEKESIAKTNFTICVNREETINLSKYGEVKWLPNGVNSALFNFKRSCVGYENSLVFFGTMFYQPNIDAMIWFEKHVADHLDANINIVIIGARPAKSILNMAKKRRNIKVMGFLEDPYIIINSCLAVIAPMQNGGGIQNKILETMAMGKINILTSYAAEPIIGAENNQHFVVENHPKIMAQKINEIFQSPSSFDQMAKDAKILIKSTYTWEAYEKQFISTLNRNFND